MDKRRKKERRRRREQKVKSRVRSAQLAQAEGIGEDGGPETLFSLARIKGKGAAGGLGDAAAPDFDEVEALGPSSSGSEGASGSASEGDSEDEQRRRVPLGVGRVGGWAWVAVREWMAGRGRLCKRTNQPTNQPASQPANQAALMCLPNRSHAPPTHPTLPPNAGTTR